MKRNERAARLIREVLDNDVLRDAPIVTADPLAVDEYRRALVDVSFQLPELHHLEIVQRFNDEIAHSGDKLVMVSRWKAWFQEFDNALKARDKAQAELDTLNESAGRGAMGHALGVEWVAGALEEAETIIAWLRDGPITAPQWAARDESGQVFDDSYVPFESVE